MKFAFPPDVEAELRFVPTSEGGRKVPLSPHEVGYRPTTYYDGHHFDTLHEYPDNDMVWPGDTVRALLRFLRPHLQVGVLAVGSTFEVREGGKVAVQGKITRILSLEDNARISEAKV